MFSIRKIFKILPHLAGFHPRTLVTSAAHQKTIGKTGRMFCKQVQNFQKSLIVSWRGTMGCDVEN